jgi:HlyD family secretion protein
VRARSFLAPGNWKLATLFLLLLAACRHEDPDAYGNFEATEVVVSAEVGGQLLRFTAEEGRPLAAGAVVATIDTVELALQREELQAQRSAAGGRSAESRAQIGVLRAQLAPARTEYERTLRLYREEAATAEQLDRTRGQVRVLVAQLRAAGATEATAEQEASGVGSRLAQVQERLSRSRVVNPAAGTVLTTYVDAGELVQPGQPLYRIADLDTLELRAYVTGAQLPQVRLGQRVEVRVDSAGGGTRSLPGVVSWIASQAEFTPTPVQTRDERADLVYAVKVRVPNPDGVLKIGMPGELWLPEEPRVAEAER